MSSLAVQAQLAISSTATTVTQATSTTTSVTSHTANTQITTLPAGYNITPNSSISFQFVNELITSSNNVVAVLTTHTGTTGSPQVYLSGQAVGSIYITVKNVHQSANLDGNVVMSVVVY